MLNFRECNQLKEGFGVPISPKIHNKFYYDFKVHINDLFCWVICLKIDKIKFFLIERHPSINHWYHNINISANKGPKRMKKIQYSFDLMQILNGLDFVKIKFKQFCKNKTLCKKPVFLLNFEQLNTQMSVA